MDCFSSEFLDDYIKRSKLRSIEKIKKLELTEEELPIYSDLLSQSLEYSPKIYRKEIRNSISKKFYIDKNEEENLSDILRRNSHNSTHIMSFNLERRTSLDDLEEKRISHEGSNSNIKNKISEIEMKKAILNQESKSIVRRIIDDIIDYVCKNKNNIEKRNATNQSKPFSLQNIKDRSALKILSSTNLTGDNILVLKVFIKQESELTTIIEVPCYSTFNTLCDVLRFLLEENRLHPKNISLYYFTEHSSKPPSSKFGKNIELFLKDSDDDEKEIFLDTKIIDLKAFELDLLMHDYPDLPEIKCLSYYSQKILNEKSNNSQTQRSKRNSSYYSQEEEIFKIKNNIYPENLDYIPEYKLQSNFTGSNTSTITSKIFFFLIYTIFKLRPAYLVTIYFLLARKANCILYKLNYC